MKILPLYTIGLPALCLLKGNIALKMHQLGIQRKQLQSLNLSVSLTAGLHTQLIRRESAKQPTYEGRGCDVPDPRLISCMCGMSQNLLLTCRRRVFICRRRVVADSKIESVHRSVGYVATFELPTRHMQPSSKTQVNRRQHSSNKLASSRSTSVLFVQAQNQGRQQQGRRGPSPN